MAIFARLAGYHDKLEINATLEWSIRDMSDADLFDRLNLLKDQLGPV